MATTYGMGQYRMKSSFEYIDLIDDEVPCDFIEIKLNNFTYRDTYFDLGDNNSIKYGHVYFLELELPRHIQYTTDINVKICASVDEDIDIKNQFQSIRKIKVPNSLADTTYYRDVLLYETEDKKTEAGLVTTDETDDTVGHIFYNRNSGNEEGTYWLIQENNNRTYQIKNYQTLRMIEYWKITEMNENTITYKMIFSPKFDLGEKGYRYIYLEIDRDNDWNSNIQYIENNKTYKGLYMDLSKINLKIYEVKNILGSNDNYHIPQGSLNHIGVWGHPETYLAINGEQIQIGKNGFYELNDFNITNLGVAVEDPNTDRFSIDYEFVIP